MLHYYQENNPRGEFVLVVEGAGPAEQSDGAQDSAEVTEDPARFCLRLMEQGMDKKEAMRQTARQLAVSRRDVYQALLAHKGEKAPQ